MYRTKASSLTKKEADGFRGSLDRFCRDLTVGRGESARLIPQVKSVNFITTLYRAWLSLQEHDVPKSFRFSDEVTEFETERHQNPRDLPWVRFTAALSNAGYAQERIEQRHDILMEFIFRRHPHIAPKVRSGRRVFSLDQKLTIWHLADERCQWTDNSERCAEEFPDPRKADADHIVRWADGGPTTVANGRLLCPAHNRARGVNQPT